MVENFENFNNGFDELFGISWKFEVWILLDIGDDFLLCVCKFLFDGFWVLLVGLFIYC